MKLSVEGTENLNSVLEVKLEMKSFAQTGMLIPRNTACVKILEDIACAMTAKWPVSGLFNVIY